MATKVRLKIDVNRVISDTFDSRALRDKAREIAADSAFKREYGLRLIDEIIRRTREDNVDKKGKQFKPYSKAYKQSLAWSVYGKTDNVDMTLTGEMLENMEVTNVTPRTIEIGFISQTQNDKAHGHINGTRSPKGKRLLPVRDFFGISAEDQSKILKSAIRDFNNGRIFEVPPQQVAVAVGVQESEFEDIE